MTLLFLGDSLIEYFDWQKRFPGHDVLNHGIAGESVGGLFMRLERVIALCPDADTVFIMSGINNLAMDDTDFVGIYERIVRRLTSAYPHARIFMNSLLPTAVDFIDDGTIKNINADIEGLADGEQTLYLDIYSRFVDEEGRLVRDCLAADGLHISEKGYEVWAGEVEKVMGR